MAKRIRIYGLVNRWVAYDFNYDVIKIIFDELTNVYVSTNLILDKNKKEDILNNLSPYRIKDFKYQDDDFVDIKFSTVDFSNYYSLNFSVVLNTYPNRDCYFLNIYSIPGSDFDFGGLFYFMMKEILNNPYKLIEGGFPYLESGDKPMTFTLYWEKLKEYRLLQRVNLFKKK